MQQKLEVLFLGLMRLELYLVSYLSAFFFKYKVLIIERWGKAI